MLGTARADRGRRPDRTTRADPWRAALVHLLNGGSAMKTPRRRARLARLDDRGLADVRGGACEAQFQAMLSLSRSVAPGSDVKMADAVKAYNACNQRVFGRKP